MVSVVKHYGNSERLPETHAVPPLCQQVVPFIIHNRVFSSLFFKITNSSNFSKMLI